MKFSKIKITISSVFFCIFFGFQENESMEPEILHLADFEKNFREVKLSEFASDLEYIPLENGKDFMVGPGNRFYITDSLIISLAFKQILIFNRNTGEFLREIGEQGRSPNAYWATRTVECVDFENEIIYATGYDEMIRYSFTGEVLQGVEIPYEYKNTTRLDKDHYASYIVNQSGFEKKRIVITNAKTGETEKIFPNYQSFKDTPNYRSYSYNESWFYHFNDHLFFKEQLNDTLFEITLKQMIPKYVFNSGKFSLPYEEKETLNLVDYHQIFNLFETEDYLFFAVNFDSRTHYAIYNKNKKTSTVANMKNQQINGFTNDLDGFMQFCPVSLNEETGVMVGFLEAYKILQWFYENPEKAARLPAHLQKLKNIKENDNPILMLVKLKD